MAATEAMGVTLRAEFKDFEKALLKARNETDTKLAAIGRDFEKANNKVKTEARGMSGAFGGLTRGLPGLTGGISALGLAGGAAAGGMVALLGALRGVQQAGKFAADLTDSADRIGVTVEALQALRFAADETGVPLADLDSGLENLNASLGAFKTGIGSGRIRPIFEALGLTQADLVAVENAEQLLPILADRLGQVGDRATQVQLARKLGIEALLPLLRRGSTGINDLAGEARDLGLVLSNDVVSGLDETDRALERNQQQIDANVREMQASLAPFFVWATGELAKLARGFTDFFNGLQAAKDRSDRVLEQQVARGQERVNFAMRQSRDTGRPLSAVQEGWIRELAAARAELSTRQRERASQAGPSAAERAGFNIDMPTPPPSGARGGGSARGGGRAANPVRASAGPSAEDLDRQREFLRLQAAIELLREQGRDREARAHQMTLDTLQLTERYEQAGIVNAAEQARLHIEALGAAQDAARVVEGNRLGQVHRENLYDATYDGVRGGLQAAADGDLGQYLAGRIREALLDNLATTVTDLLRGARGSGEGGGLDWLRSAGTILKSFAGSFPRIPGFANGVENFGGGLAYVHKGEVLANLPTGTSVIPAKDVRGGGGGSPVVFDLRGAVVTADLLRQMEAMSAQAGVAALQAARQAVPADMARVRRRSFMG